MTDKLTERLRTALVQAGYTDARNGNPSVRAMAEALGLNNSRVSRYMYHGSKMHLSARETIAEALGMTVADLDSEVERRKVDTYSPPPSANLLDARERALVNELINLLADRHKREGEEHADSSASNEQAAGSAADEGGTVVPLRSAEKAQGDDMPTEEEFLKMASYRLRPGEDESRRRDQEWSELGEESQDPDQ